MTSKIPIRQLAAAGPAQLSQQHFKIRRLEDIVGPDGLVHGLHRHGFFFVLAVSAGNGLHEIDFVAHRVAPGSVFLLRPGQVHRLELSALSRGFLLEFDPEFYRPSGKIPAQRLSRATHKDFCELEARRLDKLLLLMELMWEEAQGRQEGFADALRSALELFFIELLRQSGDPRGLGVSAQLGYAQQRFEEFSSLLEQHISSLKQVSDYIALMNLSAYQLGEITKSSAGKTPSELINAQVVLEAKRQLIATSSQVKQVAELLGYADHSYFIRFFKKHTGLSPEAFRQNLR